MNHKFFSKSSLRKTSLMLLSVTAMLAFALPMSGSTSAQSDLPYLRAFPDSNFVDGYRWTPGVEVTLQLNDHVYGPMTAAEDGSVGFSTTEDDLVLGDTLIMQAGEIDVTYTVRMLEVTDFDTEAQTVTGSVDGPQDVHVWIGGTDIDVYPDTDEFGNWTADVSPGLSFGVCGNAEAWGDPASDSSTIIDWCIPWPSNWRDDFDGSLTGGWSWVNENPDEWNLSEAPGNLRIYTSPTGTGGENLLLRPVTQGDFSIETHLFFTPDTDFQFAGLVIYQDENTFLQLGRAFCDLEGSCVGNGIYFDYLNQGEMGDSNFTTPIDDPTEAYLHLDRRGNMVNAFYSPDGVTWTIIGKHWIPDDFVVNGVGLTSSQDFMTGGYSVPADFDYFKLTDGWGFLPERDNFEGSLAEGWDWINENADEWNLSEVPGALRIYTSPTGTGGENLLLRPVAQGDFSIETRMFFTPDTNFQIAGLVIYQDESTFLQLGRAFCDIEGSCVGSGIYFDYISGGVMSGSNFATQMENPFEPAEAYLRLERRGNMVRAFYSHEGITWTIIGDHWIPDDFVVNGVGLTSSQDFNTEGWSVPADFDYFELTEGWGFLPEGYHDYESGDVPSWSCTAGGWAVDPDDRGIKINVEVDINGVALADWTLADQYRPDLEEAGLCIGGNCGFSTSLWGLVPTYEPFEVVAYAQDVPSGEWVQLYASPKTLTCRTYDIYTFDPLTGLTTLLTPNLPETLEFNPSWSPNGKQIAHDVLFDDGSQAIYITDVKTGLSTPLVGGEWGNDAVWSPNGKWIAFDRDSSLFILPAGGGKPQLIRQNGVSADWAPNGKRLVFMDVGDGSIRTRSFDGSSSSETTVASTGANPVWSPDGNWIAFDLAGDLWKVAVDIRGTPQGEPIQVTSGSAEDAQPTWSPDSMVIVYHSGVDGVYEIWSVPADGGEGTRVTGSGAFGDFDPSFAKNSPTIAYAGFAPID